MKLTVSVLLLVAASQAVNIKDSSRRQNSPDTLTENRGQVEGNSGLEKRAPVLPTAPSPVTPGIEYADTPERHTDKSPSQQTYATPLPQIAKISDVLTGQGPPFHAAIASHLYAPVSIYQARLGAPRTYEVSTPVASQLAYSEHKISYQPPQNAVQYNEPLQYNQKLPNFKQPNFAQPINFQQPYQQQLFVQPQPLPYSQQPQLLPAPIPIYQQLPQIQFPVQRPIQYVQNQQPQQQFLQRPTYTQEQQNLVQVFPAQPGITYAREEGSNAQNHEQSSQQQPNQVDLKSLENQTPPPPQENHNGQQSQGPISYASFSQNQPAPSFAQPSLIQYQAQPQYEAQPFYRVQPQLQPQQTQPQIHFQLPPQIQYQVPQNNIQTLSQESLSTASTKSLLPQPGKQVSYFRPGPVLPHLQPQLVQPQPYQQNSNGLLPNTGHGTPSSLSIAPSFPPVQYFGKFAQSIFGGNH